MTVLSIEPTFKITDESYSQELSYKYALSIEISLDGFSFCILDASRNKYIALQIYSFQNVFTYKTANEKVKEIIESNEIFKQSYKIVNACIVHTKSTLIPNAVYEAEKIKSYLDFNHESEENEIIISDTIKLIDTQNIFSFPQPLHQTLTNLFPKIKIHHFSTALIAGALLQFKNQHTKKIIVHVQLTHFEIIVVEGGKLLLYNTFRYQTIEDFMYYLLFVCEQLQLNPETLDLVLNGEIEKNSALYSILYKYIRNIHFGSRNENYEYSYGFDNISPHFYYSLLSQHLCE